VAREDFHWEGLTAADMVAIGLDLARMPHIVGDIIGGEQLHPSRFWSNFFLSLPLFEDVGEFPFYKALARGEVPNLRQALDPERATELFGRLSRRLPEGTFLMLHGVMLQRQERWAEAEQAYQKALAAPAFTHVRQRALFGLIEVRDEIAKRQQPPDPARRRQLIDNLTELAQQGSLPWAPANDAINIALFLGEPLIALQFANDCLRRTPGDPDMLEWRAIGENNFGAYGRARQTASEVLGTRRADPRATSTFNIATRNLQAAGAKVKDAPELLTLPREEER
jgi:hypothetical protein